MNKYSYISNCVVIGLDILLMIRNFQAGDYAWACVFAGLIGMLGGVTLCRLVDDMRRKNESDN